MSSVNKVILIGHLGRDAELRYSPNGTAIANVSIATSSRRKDKASGESIEDTQWHRVTFYERLAEIAGEYLKKGKPVYIEGRLKYGKYTDKDGVERNTTDIVAEQMQMLGGVEGERSAPAAAPAARAARPAPAPAPDKPCCPLVLPENKLEPRFNPLAWVWFCIPPFEPSVLMESISCFPCGELKSAISCGVALPPLN